MERITARDGATIVLHSTGTGPGIVVVHGGGVTIGIYRRLAARLADQFTVHLYNRRGREMTPPPEGAVHLRSGHRRSRVILEHTGARNVIGHSSGGFIALQAALPAADRPACAVRRGRQHRRRLSQRMARRRARGGASRRHRPEHGHHHRRHQHPFPRSSRLPLGLRVAICRAFLRTSIGRTMGDLFPMTLDESNQIRLHDGPAETWSGVSADVLLAYGASRPGLLRRAQRGAGSRPAAGPTSADPPQRPRRPEPGAPPAR